MRELHSIEAERATLASMTMSRTAHDGCRAMLAPDDFYNPACKTVFEAIHKRECGPAGFDLVALREALGESGLKRLPDGDGFLLDISIELPSWSNWERYAGIVLERAFLRRTFAWARDLARAVQDEEKGTEEVRAMLASTPEAPHGSSVPLIHLGDVKAEGGDTGVSTGFAQLDAAIGTKGYPDGQMTVVRAYHKGGKSTFMVSSYVAAASAGRRVLYATFADLSAEQIKRRVMKNLIGWSKRPQSDILTQIEFDKADERISLEWDAYLYDGSTNAKGNSVEAFGAWLRTHHRQKPFDLVFLDYAQKLRSQDRRRMSRLEEAEECSDYVQRLAAKLKIPIVVGSQTTDGKEGEKSITKGSRAWEEDAGWVLSLAREKAGEDGNADVKCVIEYSRFGPQDIEERLRWNAERLKIESGA